ncbi:MAG: hypothetical protein J6I55_01970 [Ruminococcus sp.]|nr:hypothetical protein [Ruminococcus sp.]
MKSITDYREFSDNDSDGSLLENIGKKSEFKEKILEYFKKYGVDAVTLTRCAVDYVTGKNLLNSVLCHTDGIYIWTNEEVYHFEKYDIELKKDFIEYVLNRP